MEPLSANDPRVVGEFALRARLGSGGMGRVYLGFSPGGRAVAIKVVHPELARDPEFLRRFRQEVASARLVSGMYTAPVVGSGVDDDPPWLATAYVPGPPLADVVEPPRPAGRGRRLAARGRPGRRAARGARLRPGAPGPQARQRAAGRRRAARDRLRHLPRVRGHAADLGRDGGRDPRLHVTRAGRGQQAGPPSDVFSLGCVLAYAATGNAPFGGGSAASILYRVVTGEPDLGGIPAGLQQVITACLAKDPAKRIGLAQLTAMVSALGPPLPGTIGAFWPEPLAGIIAADQAPHPATEVSGAPAARPGPGGSGGLGRAARVWAGRVRAARRTAAGLGGRHGLPQDGQPSAPPSRVQPGPTPAATGHAPMVADGYYAAAAGSLGGGPGLAWPRARAAAVRAARGRAVVAAAVPGRPAAVPRPASSRRPGSSRRRGRSRQRRRRPARFARRRRRRPPRGRPPRRRPGRAGAAVRNAVVAAARRARRAAGGRRRRRTLQAPSGRSSSRLPAVPGPAAASRADRAGPATPARRPRWTSTLRDGGARPRPSCRRRCSARSG